MQKRIAFVGRQRERGQTIILVAVSIVSLLAMAALAIDVVTLYVARTEIQRAADAAALAGAKAMADSGITTLPTSPTVDPAFTASPNVQTLAQNMANAVIAAVLAAPSNQVAGIALSPGSPTFNFGTSTPSTPINNPHVTVSLQRTGLPTFFAHIWGRTAATVTASATAEAYNPANTASFTPITPKGVKPWLVANIDPNTSAKFVDPGTGDIEPGVIANSPFWLVADCQGSPHRRCRLLDPTPRVASSSTFPTSPLPTPNIEYVPALVTSNTANVCHSSCGGSGSDYENSIQCADMNAYTFPTCGGGSTSAQWDMTDPVNPNGPPGSDTAEGVQCLIHATGTGLDQGQDGLNWTTWPSDPMQITPAAGTPLMSTSSAIVTIPIIDVTTANAFNVPAGSVTVIGFLQAFVRRIDGNNNIEIKVMNVVGCSQTPIGASPIIGGNTSSPIPVRLITPP
jgi:hypothetical protein